VRRALADAGRKAVEVDHLVVAVPLIPPAADCRVFARRALGPHGADIPVLAVAFAVDDAATLAAQAAGVMQRRSATDWAMAVCVGLGTDGSTVALCLDRSGRHRPGDVADGGTRQQQRDRSEPTG
jgi:hypothetical protein